MACINFSRILLATMISMNSVATFKIVDKFRHGNILETSFSDA